MDSVEHEILDSNKTESKFNSFGFWFAGFMLLVILDQTSKWFAQDRMDIFLNENFAFSLPLPIWMMYTIYIVTFYFIFRHLWKSWNQLPTLARVAFVLILAGGISNVAERLWLGHVRDFIYLSNGVLNIADFYILLGLGLMLAMWWTKPKLVS